MNRPNPVTVFINEYMESLGTTPERQAVAYIYRLESRIAELEAALTEITQMSYSKDTTGCVQMCYSSENPISVAVMALAEKRGET